jgi:hypothetical protein
MTAAVIDLNLATMLMTMLLGNICYHEFYHEQESLP